MKKILLFLSYFEYVTFDTKNYLKPLFLLCFGLFISNANAQKPIVSCLTGSCEPAVKLPNTNICFGHISLTAVAKDEKTAEDQLDWTYKIDLFNDGNGIYSGYDLQVGELSKAEYKNGQLPSISDNIYSDNATQSFDASGTYPLGIHKLCWLVKDGNGDVGTCCNLFEIKDCMAPTPYCIIGIKTISLTSNGCVDIWAKDLDHGSFDNCTSQDKLKFYFDGDPNKPSIRICCEDLVAAKVCDELRIDLEMWVEDEEGNRDYCKTIIIVNDNLAICPSICPHGKILGEIKTRKGERTNPTLVQLFENGALLREVIGNPYSFGDLQLNKTYTIKPTRNDDHINGVSTLDAILIQKHILGKIPLEHPYLLLAADVNQSCTISSADIAEIRKLILGVIQEFTKVKSWTFVPQNYMFPDLTFPCKAPRDFTISLEPNIYTKELSFVAIKMGDVSENARASNLISSTTRIKQNLNFIVEDRKLEIGKEYIIDFNSDNFRKIEGYQFSLNFDPLGMEFARIESGVLDLSEDNFGLNRLDQGIITTSWSSTSKSSFKESEILFSLVFRAKRNAQLNELIEISSVVTSAEAYSDNNEAMNVGLKFISNKHSQQTELFRNLPNPFSEWTNIRYYLKEDGLVSFRLYSVTGQMLKEYSIEGTKGINNLEILKKDLNYSGVILYQMETNNYAATRKMLLSN